MATLAPDPLAILADQLDPPVSPHRDDLDAWTRERLGGYLWEAQRQIGDALVEHRYVAVPSCHDAGKSAVAARAAAWWLDTHPPGEAFVVTTAPTWKQVKAVLWREIGKVRRAAEAHGEPLPGRTNLDCEWFIGDELVAYGRKPADGDQAAFQGIHARYVLVIVDEAGGVPKALFDAVDSLVTNEAARVLGIGNPDDPASHFAKVCAPGSGWHVIHIDGLRTPNFTAEAIAPYPELVALMEAEGIEPSTEPIPEDLRPLLLSPLWVWERIKRWGPDSPLFIAKVRGRFPEIGDDTLIAPGLIRAAIERELPGIDPGRYGLDVARYGTDETVCYRNRDGVVRLAFSHAKQDTMRTTGAAMRQLAPHLGGVPMVVDTIGLGAGVFDRLREQGEPVHSFDAAAKPIIPPIPGRERFINRRAEAWWAVREAFEAGEVDLDPDDEDLAAQLGAIRWWNDSRGFIHIESKDEYRKRTGGASPDRADAVMMSFVAVPRRILTPPRPSEGAGSLTADLLERDL